MQVIVMLVFLAVWLLILWIGSIALEAAGMERGKARFQALSALTGTGFTTSQAELIVEHPKRRQIITYLIFFGNTGIVAFIILLVLYTRAGLTPPSIFLISLTTGVLLAIGLAFWLGLVDKLTNVILRITEKDRDVSLVMIKKIFHQAGEYAMVRLIIGKQASIAGLKLKDSGFQEHDISLLAIEREDTTLSHPQPEEKLLSGDCLLCYGKLAEIEKIR